jgi:ParB-like chromosome segregation protein Spo0J
MLPDRSTEAEDAYLAQMLSAEPESIQEAISEALKEKRPHLAARLVGLLKDEELDMMEPEELSRARRAARMLLHESQDDRNAWYYEAQELAELWESLRLRKLNKIKQRMRGKNVHPRPRTPRKR